MVQLLTNYLYEVGDACGMKVNYPVTNDSKVHNTQPRWFDNDCKKAKRDKWLALRTYRADRSLGSLTHFLTVKRNFKSLCQNKKACFQSQNIRKLESVIDNPKVFWRSFKLLGSQSDNKLKSCPSIDAFVTYFKNSLDMEVTIFRPMDFRCFVETNDYSDDNGNDIFNGKITCNEISDSISSLKINKPPGSDGLPAAFFKYSSKATQSFMLTIFNRIFDSGIFPAEWAKGIIVPIYNKSPRALWFLAFFIWFTF